MIYLKGLEARLPVSFELQEQMEKTAKQQTIQVPLAPSLYLDRILAPGT